MSKTKPVTLLIQEKAYESIWEYADANESAHAYAHDYKHASATEAAHSDIYAHAYAAADADRDYASADEDAKSEADADATEDEDANGGHASYYDDDHQLDGDKEHDDGACCGPPKNGSKGAKRQRPSSL